MQLNLSANSLKPTDMAALGRQFPKAASSALNRTAKQAKTQASALVRDRYNLKKSDLDRNIKVKNSSPSTLNASLRVSGKRQPLIDFGARGTLPSRRGTVGASVEVVKGRRLNVAGSFLGIMKSGHKGVFIRKAQKRLPIKELTGPSVPQMFFAQKVYGGLKAFVHEVLPKNLASAINFFKK